MHFACRLPVGMLSIIVASAGALAADWRIEPLGIPINAVNFMNSHGVLVEDAEGGKTVYTSYYRSTGAELVGIDFRSGRVVRKPLGSNGGYAIVLGRDGSIYAGGVNPGDLYRYEPKSDTLTTIKTSKFGVQYIWDGAEGKDGVIYCAAGYPRTKLVTFDPKTGETRDLGEMTPGQEYMRALCVDSQGRIWCGVGMKAHLVVYDPATGDRSEVLPAEYASSAAVYGLLASGDHVLATLMHDGLILVFDARTQKVIRKILPPKGEQSWMMAPGGSGDTAYLYTSPSFDVYRCDLRSGETKPVTKSFGQVLLVEGERWLHGIDDQSYKAYDMQSGRVVAEKRLTEGGDGMDVFSLTSGPDGDIYGSTYINMHMFRCDAASGKLTDMGRASRWPGQIDSMSLGVDGRICIGAYIHAVVSVYDPREPWRPGQVEGSNPREIGPVGKGQYRTRANCRGPDGKIYVGSIPAYNSAPTGAMTICAPASGAMDVRVDFVKGGTVDVLVADDAYVYGAGGGEFFVYDPKTDKKVFHIARPVASLAVIKGGKVAGSGGGEVFIYDREAGKIVIAKSNPAGNFTHMASGADGLAYGVNPKAVASISADGSVSTLAEEGGRFAAVDGQGRVYFARGPKLFRARKD